METGDIEGECGEVYVGLEQGEGPAFDRGDEFAGHCSAISLDLLQLLFD